MSAEIINLLKPMENIMPKNETEIQKFYAGRNVFITGGTGFLGKILIEKLLWSCPKLGNIYILMREKKGKDISKRIDELFDPLVFSRVIKDVPHFKDKIKIVIGDCELVGLGLSTQDRKELIEEVNIVFHVAATVRFNEPLNIALNINLRATQDVTELSKEMKGLVSFIHVSTAYSQCYSLELGEHFYATPMDSMKLLKFIESVDQQVIDAISPKLVGKWPNTYSFSKAMAEDYLRQTAAAMPCGIYRPSIVTSSLHEPVPSWADNWYGVNGYVTACGAGLLRVLKASPLGEANVVPVDLCVNGLIASAWDVAECFKKINRDIVPESRNIRIYNYVLSENRIRWGDFYLMASRGGLETPPSQAIWYRCLRISSSSIVHSFNKFFLHWIPATIMDIGAICTGNKPQLINTYKRIHKMEEATIYFTTRSWTFSNQNILKLIAKMSDDDRHLYACDTRKIKWTDYLAGYFLGIRRYLLKDDDSTIPAARRKYAKLYWLHKTLQLIVYVATLSGMYKIGFFAYKQIKLYPMLASKLRIHTLMSNFF